MADDVLSLVARAKDEASGPLRKIRDAMRNMKQGNEGPIAARKAFKEWNGTLAETRTHIDRVHEASRRGLEPALDMLNLKTAVAAGGVATLVAGLKSFADRGNELQGFSNKVRLSVETIRGFDGIAEKFHVDPAELRQGEAALTDHFYEIRRKRGDLIKKLAQERPAYAAALEATPETQEGNEKALRITLDLLDDIKRTSAGGEATARKFAREMLGTDAWVDLIREGRGKVDSEMQKFRQETGPFDPKAGENFTRAFADFKNALQGLENQAGADLLPKITEGVKGLTTYVSEHKDEIEDGLVTVVRDIGATAKEAWPAVKEMATAANDAATAMGGWGRVLEGFAAFKLAGYAFGFTRMTMSVLGLAGAFRALGQARTTVPDLKTGKTPEVAEVKPSGKSLMEELGEGAKRLAGTVGGGFGGAASSLGTFLMLSQWASKSDVGMGREPTAESLSKNPLGIRLPGEGPSYRTPAAYDREIRARRGSDGQDHSLDGFVVGSLGQEVIHLNGTLKTLAAKHDGGIVPASFHAGAAGGSTSAAEDIMANGTYRGVLKALIDFAAQSAMTGEGGSGGGGGGFRLASFGGGGAGGGGGFGSGGSGSTPARGALSANQKEAYAAARAQGLSDVAARALVANMSGESLANPSNYHWDSKHMSGGIVQWDPQRAAAIKAKFGRLPWQMGVGDQTRAAIWEYQNNPRFAATARAMQGSDPAAMLRALVGNYEGPKDVGRAYSQRMGFFRGFDPNSPSDALGKLKLAGRVASVQCVALANAAVGFSGSVKDWRKGIGAAEGSLVDGTPVATFLNRDGSQSSRYAGGGIGTEGAHLDHAAIFRRYLKDAAGRIIGMTVAEQSRGRPLHLKDYKFGEGWGEGNGSNYNAILGPDGKPLGGDRNPLSRRPGDLTKKANEAQAQVHRVHGSAELAVKVDAPRGTRVDAAGSGLFTKVSLNRGYSMTPASETG